MQKVSWLHCRYAGRTCPSRSDQLFVDLYLLCFPEIPLKVGCYLPSCAPLRRQASPWKRN
jgi:hypothetical protein